MMIRAPRGLQNGVPGGSGSGGGGGAKIGAGMSAAMKLSSGFCSHYNDESASCGTKVDWILPSNTM